MTRFRSNFQFLVQVLTCKQLYKLTCRMYFIFHWEKRKRTISEDRNIYGERKSISIFIFGLTPSSAKIFPEGYLIQNKNYLLPVKASKSWFLIYNS